MATWHELISDKMEYFGEAWGEVVHCTLTEAEMHEEFDDGYGLAEGKPFTLWTAKRVYFPGCYDGLEFVASVPRNPCDEETEHIGGG